MNYESYENKDLDNKYNLFNFIKRFGIPIDTQNLNLVNPNKIDLIKINFLKKILSVKGKIENIHNKIKKTKIEIESAQKNTKFSVSGNLIVFHRVQFLKESKLESLRKNLSIEIQKYNFLIQEINQIIK